MRYAASASPVAVLVALLAGCARTPLPTYSWQGESAAIETVAARTRGIQSLQGSASITLSSEDRSVTLDGAILVQRPSRVRLRTWKFGQAVFDLTANDQGVWQYVPREEARSSTQVTREMVNRFVAILMPETIAPDNLSVRGTSLVATEPGDGGTTQTSLYDRSTLTLQAFTITDPAGRERFRLELSDYRIVSGTVWPMKVKAVSEQGVVDIAFSDVEINAPLPPTAFKPPARAERMP